MLYLVRDAASGERGYEPNFVRKNFFRQSWANFLIFDRKYFYLKYFSPATNFFTRNSPTFQEFRFPPEPEFRHRPPPTPRENSSNAPAICRFPKWRLVGFNTLLTKTHQVSKCVLQGKLVPGHLKHFGNRKFLEQISRLNIKIIPLLA